MKYIMIPVIMLLASCASIKDPYKAYIGYWEIYEEYQGITEPTDNIIEIRKENKDEYLALLDEAILKKEDGLNDKELMEVLKFPIESRKILKLVEIPGEKLAIKEGSKVTPLIFDKDKNEIFSGTAILKKINEKEAKERIKNAYQCYKLRTQEEMEIKENDAEDYSLIEVEISPEKKEIKNRIEQKYKELSKKIPRCT